MKHRVVFFGMILLMTLGAGCTSTSFQSKETLQVDSHPAGAEVWVNGTLRGTTPLELRVPSIDVYNVELRRVGFRSEKVTVLSEFSESARTGFRVNPLVTRGYYSSLTPNPVKVDMVSVLIPAEPDAPRTWEEFSTRLNQLYQWYQTGQVSEGIFTVMQRQLVDFYDQ